MLFRGTAAHSRRNTVIIWRRGLTSWLYLTLHPLMSQTCSIGARSGRLAGHGSVTMFWFLVSLWKNVLQSLHTTVWHINRCQKAQKQYSNTLYSQNTMWTVGLITRVQKLLTGWNCPTFSCKVQVWIFLDVILKFHYKPTSSNDFIDYIDPKKVNWTGKSYCMRFFFCWVYNINKT